MVGYQSRTSKEGWCGVGFGGASVRGENEGSGML